MTLLRPRRPPRLRLLVALALCVAPAAARAGTPREVEDAVIPESSRWISFVRLVEGRWKARTAVPAPDQLTLRRQYAQCVEDAWHLALPELLAGPAGPCARVLSQLHRDEDGDARPSASVRDRFRQKYAAALASPERADYRGCTDAARERVDPGLLDVCGLALRPRMLRLVRMTDEERFGSWMSACKKAILRGSEPPPAKGETRTADAGREAEQKADDELARHCLRVMPALYEVQWVKKLGDLWTPEEQRALYLRSQQLGEK